MYLLWLPGGAGWGGEGGEERERESGEGKRIYGLGWDRMGWMNE